MRMLEGFGSVENVPDGVRQRLEAKQTLFGFGHPVYVTLDPRARILKRLSEHFSQESDEPQWYALTEATEREVMEQKGLAANVDLYSGSVYRYLGIPNELFTPIFECSRVAGQAAHVLEQHANNKIIRPAAEYVGPEPRDFPVAAPSR
jgi:citrate synthase